MSKSNSSRYDAIRRRRVVIVLLAATAVSLVAVPIGRHALISLDLYKARRALDNVELDRACDWLQAAERRQPDRVDVQYWLAVAYRRHAQYGLAQEHLERARALGWPMRDLERQQMMMLFQNGDVTYAEPYLRKMLEQGGSDDVAEDVYEAMTIGYLADHRLNDATLCLQLWIEWRPDSLRAWLLKAYIHSTISPNVEAVEAELREVLRIAPRRLAERLALVEVLLRLTRVDEALAQSETCRRQAPDDPAVRLGLGTCFFRQGRKEEAQRELEAAVAPPRAGNRALDDEQSARGFMALGQIATGARDFEAAARYFQEAVKHAPYDPSNAYSLGVVLRTLGKDDDAARYFEQSKTLRGEAERFADIKKNLAGDPTNVALRVEAAILLRDQGRKAEAANWMTSALRYDPKLRVAHELLAESYEENGDHAKAQRHRDEARSGTELELLDKLDGPATSVEP